MLFLTFLFLFPSNSCIPLRVLATTIRLFSVWSHFIHRCRNAFRSVVAWDFFFRFHASVFFHSLCNTSAPMNEALHHRDYEMKCCVSENNQSRSNDCWMSPGQIWCVYFFTIITEQSILCVRRSLFPHWFCLFLLYFYSSYIFFVDIFLCVNRCIAVVAATEFSKPTSIA